MRGDGYASLIVIIISQCIRTSEHHTVPLKHIFVKNKHSFFFKGYKVRNEAFQMNA